MFNNFTYLFLFKTSNIILFYNLIIYKNLLIFYYVYTLIEYPMKSALHPSSYVFFRNYIDS